MPGNAAGKVCWQTRLTHDGRTTEVTTVKPAPSGQRPADPWVEMCRYKNGVISGKMKGSLKRKR